MRLYTHTNGTVVRETAPGRGESDTNNYEDVEAIEAAEAEWLLQDRAQAVRERIERVRAETGVRS